MSNAPFGSLAHEAEVLYIARSLRLSSMTLRRIAAELSGMGYKNRLARPYSEMACSRILAGITPRERPND